MHSNVNLSTRSVGITEEPFQNSKVPPPRCSLGNPHHPRHTYTMASFLFQREVIADHLKSENQLPTEANLALFSAATRCDLTSLKALLSSSDAQVNFFHKPSDGATALHAASRSPSSSSAECVSLLLSHGALPTTKMISNHNTPLHEAVLAGNLPAAALLVESLKELFAKKENQPQLAVVTAHQSGQDVAVVVEETPFSENSFGNTPLHLAAQVCAVPIGVMLISAGHPVSCANHRGFTPLHVLASLVPPDMSGLSPLPYLLFASHLLLAGAKPDAVDVTGRTALHESASRPSLPFAKLLVDMSADISIRTFVPTRGVGGDRDAEAEAELLGERGIPTSDFLKTAGKRVRVAATVATMTLATKYVKEAGGL